MFILGKAGEIRPFFYFLKWKAIIGNASLIFSVPQTLNLKTSLRSGNYSLLRHPK